MAQFGVFSSLTGNEVLQVTGIQSNGTPSGQSGQCTTGQIAALAGANPNAPVAVGASAMAVVGRKYLLNTAAGSTLTLPAASGTGGVVQVFVTTTATSNAHKILAASVSDFMNGIAEGHVSAGTTLGFSAAAATAHSIQMPFTGTQPSGGFIGDWFDLTDVATNLWSVKGAFQSGTTSTTPFSAATT